MRALLLVALCPLLAGCAMVGLLADKALGPPETPAVYKPDKKPMLVMVESYKQQSVLESPSDELAQDLSELIKKHSVSPIVDPMKLLEYRTEHADRYGTMPVQTIGRELGASQVLYVNIKGVDVGTPTGGDVYSGTVDVRVKVVDVSTGRTLWPTGTSDGYQVKVDEGDAMVLASEAPSKHAVQSAMLDDLADQIVHLFFAYTTDNDPHKSD